MNENAIKGYLGSHNECFGKFGHNVAMLCTLEWVHSYRGADGINRYFIGEFARREDAAQLLNQMIASGFKDSWIAPLDQNRQIK